jgi:hypothetical protein
MNRRIHDVGGSIPVKVLFCNLIAFTITITITITITSFKKKREKVLERREEKKNRPDIKKILPRKKFSEL